MSRQDFMDPFALDAQADQEFVILTLAAGMIAVIGAMLVAGPEAG